MKWKQNMWEDFQRFIAFDVIPFIVIAMVVSCFVLGAAGLIALLASGISN